MKAIAAVFKSRDDAQRAWSELRAEGFTEDRLALLLPGDGAHQLGHVPVSSAEQPGVGKAMGGTIGAAAGIAGGFDLGTAISAMIPGVGAVAAIGIIGAAILGLAGASLGVVAGKKIENAATEGLPEDELFVYEDALRQGRTVVVVLADDGHSAESIRDLLCGYGAETVDAAREQWWIGLRDAEKEHYARSARDFDRDEKFYRLGYEAALHARSRCKEYDQVLSELAEDVEELEQRYPGRDVEEPFRRGYERGRAYYESLCSKHATGT